MQSELLDWLLIHYGQEQMRPGLDQMRLSLSKLLPKFSRTKIIIVAGTNGKGETTLRLSEFLKESTHNVWISPHIERITERFRKESGEIDFAELRSLIERCHEIVQSENWGLTFYEFLFFVFCTWAAGKPPEYLLLEVGLGGRLDAVNVFDAHLVLIPSISRDHQEILGSRYDQILREKLGVLRTGTTLIHFLQRKYLCERTRDYCRSLGATEIALREKVSVPEFEFSLRNKLLAAAAFCQLKQKAFVAEEWSNLGDLLEHRGEVRKDKHDWIFFGSHNVDGLRKLIQFLHSGTYTFPRPPYDSVIVAFSRRNLQDLRLMMRLLKKSGVGKTVVTVFEHPKAASVETMEVLSHQEGLDFVRDIHSYIEESHPNQRVLVTGSYYFLGDLKSFLRGRYSPTDSRG